VTPVTVARPLQASHNHVSVPVVDVMRKVLAVIVCASLAVSIATYADSPQAAKSPADESQLVEHGHYVNKSGQDVHSPAHSKNGAVPAGATAKCRDGTFSFSQHRSGTCSRHGGVAQWIN
jgi:hypothetical protein